MVTGYKTALRILLLLICSFSFSFASGQSVPTGFLAVSGTKIIDATGAPVSNATLCGQVSNGTKGYSALVAGGGHTTTPSVCVQVNNGSFSINLPDTSKTLPANACVVITVTDNLTGNVLLGDGYSCVQPTSVEGSSWCSTTTCNFDNYQPNLPGVATVQYGPQGPKGAKGDQGTQGIQGLPGDNLCDASTAAGCINIANLPGCSSASNKYTPSLHACIPVGGQLNVQDYAAANGGTYSGDITTVFDSVVAASYISGSTIYLPAGNVCVNHQETITGLLHGDGRNATYLSGCIAAGFPAGSAIIRACYTSAEVGTVTGWSGSCHADIRDLTIAGLGGFPSTLTGSATDLGAWQGDCIHEADLNSTGIIEDTEAQSCLRGINIDTGSGHVSVVNSYANSNFYNVWINNDTGDYKFLNDNFAGALFASVGIQPNDSTSPYFIGGMVGATFLHTHLGFAPYGIYQADGSTGNGLVGTHFIDTSFESIGNEAIHIGANTLSGGSGLRTMTGLSFQNTSSSWTSVTNYEVQNNSAFPVQDYSLVFDFVGGDVRFDGGSIFPQGSTGMIGYIRHPQNDLFYGNSNQTLLWANSNGTVKSANSSGQVLQNKSSNVNALPMYFAGGDQADHLEPSPFAYFGTDGSLNVQSGLSVSLPNQSLTIYSSGGFGHIDFNTGTYTWQFGCTPEMGTGCGIRNGSNGVIPFYGDPLTGITTFPHGITGVPTAPSGACSVNGAWVLSQDGHATFCASGTWTTKI